jgi:alkylhydroperoxidase family enzyme
MMARLRPLTLEEAAPALPVAVADAVRAAGTLSLPAGIQAYCPPVLEASRMLNAMPGRSGTLPAELRSLVCLRAAYLVGCVF